MTGRAAEEVTGGGRWEKFKRCPELQKVAALAGDKPSHYSEWRHDLVASASGNRACKPVDWACIVKFRPISLSLNHQWVLGFVKACDVGFWVI